MQVGHLSWVKWPMLLAVAELLLEQLLLLQVSCWLNKSTRAAYNATSGTQSCVLPPLNPFKLPALVLF